MKRGLKIEKRTSFLLSALFFILIFTANIALISAEHQVSPASFSVTANEVSSFTLTVTNTEIEDESIPTASNITRVDMILPAGLIFITDTNLSDSLADFTNTSNVLTWINSTYLIGSSNGGSNVKYFTFNANATSVGALNIVLSTTNISGTFPKNIALTVSAPLDVTSPQVTLISPANNEEDTDGTLIFECNSTDNIGLSGIGLYIWNSNSSEVYKNQVNIRGISNQTSWDYTFSGDGNYKWNCLANDTSGNKDWAVNRTIKISISSLCTANWNCTNWNLCVNATQARTCTDLNHCGNNLAKPNENQSCFTSCTQDWGCTGWNPVKCPKNKIQTRVCTDANNCNNSTNKPSQTNECTYEGFSVLFIVIVAVIILLIAGIATALIIFFKKT